MNIVEQIKRNEVIKSAEPIIKKLKESCTKGFNGFVYGDYINPVLGEYLKSEGIKYTTFTDGEFSESKIRI